MGKVLDFLYGIVNKIKTPSLRRTVSVIKFDLLSLTAFRSCHKKQKDCGS